MSITQGQYLGGVRNLQDLQNRCKVDEDCNCWVWRGYMFNGKTPMVRFDGMARNARRVAVEMLDGKPLRPGYRVVQGSKCDAGCINPAHAKRLNPTEYLKHLNRTSAMNGPAHHAARTSAQRARSKVRSIEHARELRLRVLAGEDKEAVAASYNISVAHLHKIMRGENWSEASRPAQSNVFSWAASL